VTRVLLIAQVMIPEAVIKIVDPSTIHPPHCKCGTKRSMSTKKASNVTRSVGSRRIRRPRRKRCEWDGEWRCVAAARARHTRFRKAATGCTTSRDESVCREVEGSSKASVLVLVEKRPSAIISKILGGMYSVLAEPVS
jgi:hypothetical protein